MEDLKLYTSKEVCAMLKISRRTFCNYMESGQLKGFKLGRGWRISAESLQDFLEHGTEKHYYLKLQAAKARKKAEKEKALAKADK